MVTRCFLDYSMAGSLLKPLHQGHTKKRVHFVWLHYIGAHGFNITIGGFGIQGHVEQLSVFVFGVGWFMVLVMHDGAHVLPGLLHCRLMFESFA